MSDYLSGVRQQILYNQPLGEPIQVSVYFCWNADFSRYFSLAWLLAVGRGTTDPEGKPISSSFSTLPSVQNSHCRPTDHCLISQTCQGKLSSSETTACIVWFSWQQIMSREVRLTDSSHMAEIVLKLTVHLRFCRLQVSSVWLSQLTSYFSAIMCRLDYKDGG